MKWDIFTLAVFSVAMIPNVLGFARDGSGFWVVLMCVQCLCAGSALRGLVVNRS